MRCLLAGAWADDAGVEDSLGDVEEVDRWLPKLWATVTPTRVRLGEPIHVQLKVERRNDVSVNLPLRLELGPFVELSRQTDNSENTGQANAKGKVEEIFELSVAAYQLGEQTLPAISLTAVGPRGEIEEVTTQPLPIKNRQRSEK